MNKTININLGGFFFHIDESAYQKLRRYLDAISKSLNDDPQGKNEIIADIEARISELLSERITDARQVVNEGDIDEISPLWGSPKIMRKQKKPIMMQAIRIREITVKGKNYLEMVMTNF